MKVLNFLILLTKALSFIIVVGVGHGIAPIFFFEMMLIPSLFNGLASAIGDNYFVAFTFAGLIGHICLGISIFSKNFRIKFYLISAGSILLFSFGLYFSYGFSENATPILTRILFIPLAGNIFMNLFYIFKLKLSNKLTRL